MKEQIIKFKRLEKLSEIIISVVVVGMFLIIQLPLTPQPDRSIIYITAISLGLFIFIWHKLKLPISPMNKNFVESFVGIIGVAFIVHVTGGVTSYFNFLYLLPNLGTSTSSTRWHAISLLLITVLFIFVEALFFPQALALNFAILNSWAVGLVTVYGRSLANEVETAKGTATEASIDKEKAINTLKDEFVFVISHEIRGPITAIRGYLELFLNDKGLPQAVVNLASLAFKQSEKLNNLIAQLLDLSRLEAGKFKLSNEKIDLNEFLKDVLEVVKIDAQERKIKFNFNPPKEQIVVFADKERMKEVVLNLTENAFKYTGDFGQLWIWTEVKEDKAYVYIMDSGVGISKEELPYVFSHFYRPTLGSKDQSTLEKSKSVGLGLYLAKQLVNKMGGEIFVESKLGKGSKFTFNLPLAAKNKGKDIS